jgi:two-component system sensor histidine kinase/response regulator
VINLSFCFIRSGRHFLLYTAFTLLILLFAVGVCAKNELPAADTKRELNIIVHNDHHPLWFTLPNGQPKGLYIDLWNLWSVTTGTPINFITKELKEGLLQVKSHNAVHSGLFKNEARQRWADFSVPIHSVKSSILYHKKGDNKRNLKQFDGMKIAVPLSSYHEQYILDNYPNITVVPYQSESSIHALINNDIQAIFNESPALYSLLAQMGLAGVLESNTVEGVTNLVYAAVAKGQPLLLKEINRGFENIPIKALVAIEKKWLPNTTSFFNSNSSLDVLTQYERNWLQAHSSFTLGIDQNSYPFEFIDKNNSHSGISADYIDFISQKLKINLNVVEDMTWDESFEQLKADEIDVMSNVVRSAKREKSMLFTKPYFKFSSVMVTKKGEFYTESMNSFDGKKVGIVSGYVFAELLAKDYKNIEIVDVSSPEEGLQLVNDGELDAYMDSLAVINHFMNKNNYFDLIVASFTPYKVEISMAVRLGLEPLIPILNKALDSMDAKTKSKIANNWLAVRVQEGTQLKTILKWSIPILTLLFMIIFIFMRINRKLTKEIEQRELSEKQLSHLANHDSLTDLPTRRLLEDRFEMAINGAIRSKQMAAVLFIDLDGFKQLNDSSGHDAGDIVLKNISKRLSSAIRREDTVSRFGGDEFVVIMTDVKAKEDVVTLARKIISQVNLPIKYYDTELVVGASIGISIYPENGESWMLLLKHADNALYNVKRTGKNNFMFYSQLAPT